MYHSVDNSVKNTCKMKQAKVTFSVCKFQPQGNKFERFRSSELYFVLNQYYCLSSPETKWNILLRKSNNLLCITYE